MTHFPHKIALTSDASHKFGGFFLRLGYASPARTGRMDTEGQGKSLVEKRAQRSLTKVWSKTSLSLFNIINDERHPKCILSIKLLAHDRGTSM